MLSFVGRELQCAYPLCKKSNRVVVHVDFLFFTKLNVGIVVFGFVAPWNVGGIGVFWRQHVLRIFWNLPANLHCVINQIIIQHVPRIFWNLPANLHCVINQITIQHVPRIFWNLLVDLHCVINQIIMRTYFHYCCVIRLLVCNIDKKWMLSGNGERSFAFSLWTLSKTIFFLRNVYRNETDQMPRVCIGKKWHIEL
jgi:hypothetical protein